MMPDMQKNADGSIDVHFGPKAPAGKEANWVPTDPQRGFELIFRLYAPKKEFFDKVWKLTPTAVRASLSRVCEAGSGPLVGLVGAQRRLMSVVAASSRRCPHHTHQDDQRDPAGNLRKVVVSCYC